MAKLQGRLGFIQLGAGVVGGTQNISISDTITEMPVGVPGSTAANLVRHQGFTGKRMISVTGNFTFADDGVADETLHNTIWGETGIVPSAVVDVPGWRKYTGRLLITEVTYTGAIEDMVSFSLSAEFVGPPTIVDQIPTG